MKQVINKIKAFFQNIKTKISPSSYQEPERPNKNEVMGSRLWYPLAHVPNFSMPTKGRYAKGFPIGAIVHYTAGAFRNGLQSAIDTVSWGKNEGSGLCFFCIALDGTVVQAFPLDRWGNHAGVSYWPQLGSSVSQHLVGIEICNGGLLEKRDDKFFTWFGEEIPAVKVRYVERQEDNVQPGYYHMYSDAQIASLEQLLMWLKGNDPINFNLDYVLGHDEVAPSRKTDPGGSLPMSMPSFRSKLKAMYKTRIGQSIEQAQANEV